MCNWANGYLPQTFCGANTDIGTIHNMVDHFYDVRRLRAISGREKVRGIKNSFFYQAATLGEKCKKSEKLFELESSQLG